MDTNYILISFALFIVIGAIVFLRIRWSYIDLIDIYIIMVTVYYGAYSLLDAMLNDLNWIRADLAVLTHVQVMVAIILTYFICKAIPYKLRSIIKLNKMVEQWNKVGPYANIIISFGILLGIVLPLLKYGVIITIPSHRTSDIPNYIINISNFIETCGLFAAFIGISVKMGMESSIKRSVGWIILMVMLVVCAGIEGRRSLFNVLVIMGIVLFVLWKRNPVSLRYIPLYLLLFASLVMYSNIYQSYRTYLMSLNYDEGAPNIYEAVFNIEATRANLGARSPIWRYPYIINTRLESGHEPAMGIVGWNNFKSGIPMGLVNNNQEYISDGLIARLYNLYITDYPTNVFSTALADYGYIYPVVVSIYLAGTFSIIVILLNATYRYKVLYLFISGSAFYYILNIESDYDILEVIKNTVKSLIIIGAVSGIWQTFQILKLKGKTST